MTANVTSLAKVRAAARDKIARQQVNDRATTVLLVLVVVLIVVGLGVTMSASSAVALNQTESQDQWHFLKRQLVGVGLGTVALLLASRVPYRFYRKLAIPGFLLTLGLLVAVEIRGITEGGATSWLRIPGLTSFQPSEIAKIAVVFALAYLLEKKSKLLTRFWHFAVPVIATLGVVGVLVIRQPDLGTLIIIGAAALAVIVASDVPMKFVLVLGLLAVLAATYFAFDADYRASRIDSFLDPYADPSGDGYQVIQGYYALGNGGVFGVGLGASRARWFYLPNAHTDFIFAIIGEETGLIGGLTVIALFIALAAAGWVVANRAPDGFGRMVAAGITVWLSFQALVNIGGVLGVIPITGITLPFISFGSSALIVSMGAIGVLVNIAEQRGPFAIGDTADEVEGVGSFLRKLQLENGATMTFLIAAAGTGGHVFPGLAVGEALIELGVAQADIVYVGGERLEATVYPAEGFRFLPVELSGLRRSMTTANLRIPGVVMRARREISDEIDRSDVRVVLGMGGYVTIPAGLAARQRRIPLFNAEQNAEAGIANKVTARWARAAFTSFPITGGLPDGIWVGNPVRRPFWEFDRAGLQTAARAHYGLDPDVPVLGVFGGSLGSGVLNEAVATMIAGWDGSPLQVVHLTGDAHLERMAERSSSALVSWHRIDFEEHMANFYAVADLVVARAGGAVAELTATATPSILVPGSFGSSGHQWGNARALSRAGVAEIVTEEAIAGLPEVVARLLSDEEARAAMKAAAGDLSKPDAALTIAHAMIEAAR